jgi:hypothetical protein
MLAQLLIADLDAAVTPAIPPTQRRALLDQLLLYYRLHVEGLGELASPEVLRQVWGLAAEDIFDRSTKEPVHERPTPASSGVRRHPVQRLLEQ